MKIQFEDKSYIEIKKSNNPDKIIICIQAIDHINKLKKIINTVEITKEQFNELINYET